MDGFFDVFGVTRRRVASFEQPVKKSDGKGGFIDLLWKGILLVEHKSLGKDLDRAFKQATDYFPGLKERDLPRYVLVSDFARFRLHDLDSDEQHDFFLTDLHQNVALFGFIAGYQVRAFKDQDPANIRAAERMGALHDALKASGYEGHALEVLLVRLLFCLFAEDTGIFERRQFQDFIEQRTDADGSDLGGRLLELFHALNTPRDKRQTNLDESIAAFDYVNGALFAEMLPPAAFDRGLRDTLLDACGLDWSRISPAIFGALFQSIMDAKARRNLGAHYTSEKNILKIGPLFMDGLRAEFEKSKGNRGRLHDFHQKISNLRFLDPACGCGNFLVIAYRELRLLEHELIFLMHKAELASGQVLDPRLLVKCNVDRFYGIEIEEFPAQIAQVAMWLTDHQMNLRVQEVFGNRFVRLPLVQTATIVHGNALQIDWNTVVPAAQVNYVLGNPPFVGKKEQNAAQKTDMAVVFKGVKGAGVLDFVAAWYIKTADMMATNSAIRAAFVSTNSITQGEQVGVLWAELYRRGMHIQFAHRTFKWSNEARGKAAVFCVILGFSRVPTDDRQIFDYDTPSGEPHRVAATRVNAYLVDAEDLILQNRKSPICRVPAMNEGSALIDDGHLVLSEAELAELVSSTPAAKGWVRPLAAGSDYINGKKRYCLWLNATSPTELRAAPAVLERVQKVREFREHSGRAATRVLAATPQLFGEIRQPATRFVMLPKTSSERRNFVPMGYLDEQNVINNTSLFVENASEFHLGVMISTMHMAWLRNIGGRLKSDYRYSAGIVYNNFPCPEFADDNSASKSSRLAIETAAQGVLDARAAFPDATLADLYDPLTMPPALVKAHQTLDRAVDAAYLAAEKAAKRPTPKLDTDANRVAFLFERYQAITSLLPAAKAAKPRKRKGT